jgi:hypothetical protein
MSYECMSFADIDGFDWDDGNRYKNQKKHGVSWQEIEEIFFNEPLLILEDKKHSVLEQRCYCLGQTDEKVKLFVVFTKRENKIRPISARRVTNKERAIYEKAKKNTNF